MLIIIINLFFVRCNDNEEYNFSKVDSIVIGSSNYSLSPEYQGYSETILSKDSIYLIENKGEV